MFKHFYLELSVFIPQFLGFFVYSVLGINNRNLTTMQVDLNNTSRLAELVDNKNELVAESGIKTRADVEKLKSVGVSAVLIGQTLCEHPDIEEKFAELFG